MTGEWDCWVSEKYKTVQVRVPVQDSFFTQIISQLEEESKGKRGYVADRIREMIKDFYKLKELAGEDDVSKIADMIKAYKALSELAGETDPYKIIVKLAKQQQASPAPTPQQPVQEEKEEEAPVKRKKRIRPNQFSFGDMREDA